MFQNIENDLVYLKTQGIDLLFTLTREPLDPVLLKRFEIENIHLPVRDFAAPSMRQLEEFVEKAAKAIDGGRRVGVHCIAGKGRTGTFMASYLVAGGLKPSDAIRKIRLLRPGSIETTEQEEAVFEFSYYYTQSNTDMT